MTTRSRNQRPLEPRTWTEEEICAALLRSRRFIERAALAMYNRLSPAERNGQSTGQHDGIGFNRYDRGYMISVCDQMLASDQPEGRRLSNEQIRHCVIILRRYARQLVEIANRNEVGAAVQERKRSVAAGFCPDCHGTRAVVENIFGERVVVPCPRCGESPYAD
jgi:hypothetical protein